jgi:hypothetical protein
MNNKYFFPLSKSLNQFNPKNRSPFDSEVHSSATDMNVSMTVTTIQVNQGRNIFNFNYAGGKVHYRVANDLSGGVFDWGDRKIRDISRGANATVERNNARFRVID